MAVLVALLIGLSGSHAGSGPAAPNAAASAGAQVERHPMPRPSPDRGAVIAEALAPR